VKISVAPPPPSRGYDIVIERGALHHIAAWIDAVGEADSLAVIADQTVAKLYGGAMIDRLRAAGRTAHLFEFPAGEASKTRAQWARLTNALIEARVGRDGCVLALGGGVTGDLAGFVAATYMRGIPVLQLPTTLLAMIDAAIGGKVGVDTEAGKNLVGAFHPPALVLADTGTLATLRPTILAEGFAEAAKHAVISDAEQLRWLHAHAQELRQLEPEIMDSLVARSAAVKADIVSRDPHEHAIRATLNFGHTIAHALERLTRFSLPHGLAVAIGMVAEAHIGELAGITEPGSALTISDVLDRLGVPHALPALDVDAIIDATATDKKARSGHVRYALIEAPGRAARSDERDWTFAVEPRAVHDALLRAARPSRAV
jgi:3-dehydroquinate synthase